MLFTNNMQSVIKTKKKSQKNKVFQEKSDNIEKPPTEQAEPFNSKDYLDFLEKIYQEIAKNSDNKINKR